MIGQKIICLILGLGLAAFTHAIPEVLLRNTLSTHESTYASISSIGSENQACLPYEIKAAEVCVKAGVWLFYTDPGYTTKLNGSTVAYMRNPSDPAMSCFMLPPYLYKSVGSFRLAGDPLLENVPSINLYVGFHFIEADLQFSASTPEVPFAFNSALILGDERWQFFMKENYDGLSECSNVGEMFIPDFTYRFGVQAGDIKSIRKGCSKPLGRLNPNVKVKSLYPE